MPCRRAARHGGRQIITKALLNALFSAHWNLAISIKKVRDEATVMPTDYVYTHPKGVPCTYIAWAKALFVLHFSGKAKATMSGDGQ